jgi:hypothetical protein
LGREEVSKMIQEAEENALLDKSKKSYVNITYELDNLIGKMEKVNETISASSTQSFPVLEELMTTLKKCYKEGQFVMLRNNFNQYLPVISFCFLSEIATIRLREGKEDKKQTTNETDVVDV